jgi:uncharacterized protein YecA (UPF0149 family)
MSRPDLTLGFQNETNPMGAIADAIVTYAQPLLDRTDGTVEQINKAMSLAQICWNLAIIPEEMFEETLASLRSSLSMSEGEFTAFRHDVIAPMIRRHHEMFPQMRRLASGDPASLPARPSAIIQTEKKFPGTPRYGPCPCGSGKKYKFCCGR